MLDGIPTPDVPSYRVDERLPLDDLRRALTSGERVAVALDGRSAAGKSTLAARLAEGQSDWCVVHTDDVSWYESFFDWAPLLIDGVLRPFRAGQEVTYRPPSWQSRGRAGAITVPAGARVLVVEGVGSAQRSLMPWLDHVLWVHTPNEAVLDREGRRIADGSVTAELSREWLTGEADFLDAERPWERSEFVVSGTGGDETSLVTLRATS
ncbi:hypothetical protein KILIM_076_00110 [Kineosphaera limosa NBRC 100340]|uniref:Phosphoribulokinase/uridine kinase domain-containing protein n=1 Tax=Kineosphaera limosa NBRC 100340 TaxID=1184609 RepID=K6WUU7_9MICO|nr:hypothetical protein KILIM_076_00110 [Kineosphaera limosa NBRC 100340]